MLKNDLLRPGQLWYDAGRLMIVINLVNDYVVWVLASNLFSACETGAACIDVEVVSLSTRLFSGTRIPFEFVARKLL